MTRISSVFPHHIRFAFPFTFPFALSFALLFCASSSLWAQRDYKHLMKHLPEMSDREALYNLLDYQSFHPRQANPYFQMANICYRLYPDEHPLRDYVELDKMLYWAWLYAGNCIHYLPNDHFQKDWYLAASPDGKVTPEVVTIYLRPRLDKLVDQRNRLEALYSAYSGLVHRYDTCRVLMTEFSQRYPGEKEAHLLLSSDDLRLLELLRSEADSLPAAILRLDRALEAYPVADYRPTFHFRPIDYFRMDGLTTSDFLQEDIYLWDYAAWVNRFLDVQQSFYRTYYEQIAQEHRRLQEAKRSATMLRENQRLLNTIEQQDARSAMIPLLHVEYLDARAAALAQQVTGVDTLTEDSWLTLLQQLYRLQQTTAEIEEVSQTVAPQFTASQQAKYAAFLQQSYPDDPTTAVAMQQIREQAGSRYRDVIAQVLSRPEIPLLPDRVQIDEALYAQRADASVVFLTVDD